MRKTVRHKIGNQCNTITALTGENENRAKTFKQSVARSYLGGSLTTLFSPLATPRKTFPCFFPYSVGDKTFTQGPSPSFWPIEKVIDTNQSELDLFAQRA